MVANSLNHGHGPAVAHHKSLADNSTDVHSAAGRTVTDDIARDYIVFGCKYTCSVWSDHDGSTRKTLANVIVAVAFEQKRNPARNECTK